MLVSVFVCTVVQLNSYSVEGRGVFGAAIHDAKIFLTQCECNWISIFNAVEPFNFVDRITVDGMTNPSDLLALDRCLYIPDDMNPQVRRHHVGRISSSDHCIWKIPLSNLKPEKMLTSLGKWWPWALSRTSDGSKIIITTTSDKAYFWCPDTNDPDMVRLPSDVHNPQHIIELSCGSYLLCHDPLSGSCLKKVCRLILIDDEMRFMESPSAMDHLERPEHLAELPDGRILVADYYNNRLLVMARDLMSHEVLLRPKKGGKKRPCRIAYDTCKSLLLVAFHHSAGLYLLNDEFIRALT